MPKPNKPHSDSEQPEAEPVYQQEQTLIAPVPRSDFSYLAPALIDPNPFYRYHRTELDEERCQSLVEYFTRLFKAGKMREFTVLARPNNEQSGRYQAVYGHLRLKAAQAARVPQLPAIVRPISDNEMLQLLLVNETFKRAEPSNVALAGQVRLLHKELHWSLETIARQYGFSKARAHMLHLLSKAPPEFLEEVNHHPEYTTVVARIVAVVAEEEQRVELLELIRQKVAPGLVRQKVEALRRKVTTKGTDIIGQ
ncbi:ParB N-terminal domain-containing protein (plasmid) [Candidatus Chlorohelix allophototropha]|uniref:ParB N-terminal domain-containing protein n=1 Tax=Candidatus Chlorohelix allophototropha TaxID=3003348 RepID=A0ABY9BAN9_9CHLR|nr:ParB N-terminal domain-containing protein [Chloroflexota bacterium L227-S17]